MKHIILLFIFITILFTSCDDALEANLSDQVELNQTIVDLETLNVAVNGSYSRFATGDVYNRGLIVIPALLSDNASLDPFDNRGRFVEYNNYTVTDNDPRADALWDDLYRSVAQTAIIIRETAKLEFTENEISQANQFVGEAYTLRALALLLLQQYYAQPYNFTSDASHLGVILPDFEKVGLEVLEPSRTTTALVYDQIVNDLTTAIDLLDVNENNSGRIDRIAAKALLARTYLHMEDWVNAEILATETIDEFEGGLIPTDEYVNSWNLDQSSESILKLINTPTDNSGDASAGFFFLSDKEAFATPDFISNFSDTDVRLGLYPLDEGVNQHLISKYPRINGTDNIEVVRLSEMYLIKAEAHARMNQSGDALIALNSLVEIRDPDADPVALSGQSLINRILLERRKELAFEGFRVHDLARTATTFTKFRILLGNITINAPDNFTILPIPIDEINVNPGVQGQQNPGY
ncbi:RagB/SusD family nutrient uptake outer membrane protein [Aquimarina algicola]|uniref:RagB/SusD family nutrient uptake outer membrane protein n=1 Tax=Aquimarina algicola TaxID=2589995 RepID=A0A504JDU6_9FLAO|nr:RagB/SusD family nutrient uptake outer membrane protein [Aquimarina algicola]TPN88997.1 RagB/SusD family nutrient uptake outer membrane protein [Aquimarina algicola]